MGNRTPGFIGFEPPPPSLRAHGDVVPPDAGFGDHAPTGTDTETVSPASLNLSGWPRALTWNDFPELESRPPEADDENAQISCEVMQPDRISVVREGGRFRIDSVAVEIRINSAETWVVRSGKTAELLSHEQGHYDITGLMGRDMGNEMLAVRARSTAALQQAITRIISRYRERARSLTAQYDTETNHSRNREAQARWDERIRSSLQNNTVFNAP